MKTQNANDELLFEAAIKLNELLSRIVDARHGYELGARQVGEDSELGRLLRDRAAARDRLAKELRAAVAAEGVELREEMTLSQTWRSAKRSVKDWLTEHPPTEIIEECLRGDRRAIEEYSVVGQIPTVPEAIRERLAEQSQRVSREMAGLEAVGAREAAPASS